MSWEVVSCWIESHPGLASWVQAAGSILAILAAILIANRDSRFRKRAEREVRLGALIRAKTAVADAKLRVKVGFEGIRTIGVTRDLAVAIKSDLGKSEQHLKEAMFIQGVDSKIYLHLYEARTAVEDAIQILFAVSSHDTSCERILGRLDATLGSLEKALRSKARFTLRR